MFATENVCSRANALEVALVHNANMNHIRAWRLSRGLTLQALADAMASQPSPGTLSSYESGKRTPSDGRLREIAFALRIPPGKLLDEPPSEEEKPPTDAASNIAYLAQRVPVERQALAIDLLKRLGSDD
jgi:transcriptional regulator with XRE-family HTH domain